MLCLSRYVDQSITCRMPDGRDIKVMIIEVKKDDRVILGIEAPLDVVIHRQEVWEAIEGAKNGLSRS